MHSRSKAHRLQTENTSPIFQKPCICTPAEWAPDTSLSSRLWRMGRTLTLRSPLHTAFKRKVEKSDSDDSDSDSDEEERGKGKGAPSDDSDSDEMGGAFNSSPETRCDGVAWLVPS